MSFLRTPDPERAEAFLWCGAWLDDGGVRPDAVVAHARLCGRGAEQPVSREDVAVMARAGDGEAAHWRVEFWIADADAAAARATELGGSVIAGPEDAGPFREAVLADPAAATFSVSELTAGP